MNKYIELLARLSPSSVDTTADVIQKTDKFNQKNTVLAALHGQDEHYSEMIISLGMLCKLRKETKTKIIGDIVEQYFNHVEQIKKIYKPRKQIKTSEIYIMAEYAVDWVANQRWNIPAKNMAEELTFRFKKTISTSTFKAKYEYHLSFMISRLAQKIDNICDKAYKKIG
jgi:hypothetical protein